jgi:predicted O-linked N-acetylglucosamine transferase (SPINDLY family)
MAMQHHRGGRIADAERLYREALARNPNQAEAAFLLGVIALEGGKPAAAVPFLTHAVTVAPHNAAYFSNLGEAHRRLGSVHAAIEALLRANSLKADLVAPVYNLALLLDQIGAVDGALGCFERAAELKPDLRDIAERLRAARARVAARPIRPEGPRRAPTPEETLSANAFVALATALQIQLRLQEAVAMLRRALELDPRLPVAHGTLGGVFEDLHRMDDAIEAYRQGLEVEPRKPELHAATGNALAKSGRLGEAIDAGRRAVALDPSNANLHSNLIYTMQYHAACDARAILDETRVWETRHANPLRADYAAAHQNDPDPDRRLRIGYVGADFRRHCQSLFLFPLFAHHDRSKFDVHCYSNVFQSDDFTEKMRGHLEHWRNIAELDDGPAAERIRDDRIDVLVDLTLHMANGRLRVFARKPAPVQFAWLAYPGTTGLSAMDYRITDPYLDPPGGDDTVYSERSVRLPDTFWCYHPLVSEEVVSPLPARLAGHITFGCLNNFMKVNDDAIELWARVMRDVPGSRIVLLAPPGDSRRRTHETFAKHGVEPPRVEFVAWQARLPYLATYRRIDVCLDTFPYNGHTTSLDAIWMGAPVVTLVGPTIVGRAGLSLAMNLGHPELVARTPDEFVRIAVDLCQDLDRLAALRAVLRAQMEASPLMDAPRFARNLEAAYRGAWREWCANARPR